MKKAKIFYIIGVLIVLIFIVKYTIYYVFQYDYTHVTNVDTSFLNENVKSDLKRVKEDCLNNINDCNKWNIWKVSRELLEKYQIYSIKPSKWIRDNSKGTILFSMKNFFLVYNYDQEKVQELDKIWNVFWRVEKVIDSEWYVVKLCDRNICRE